MVNFLPSHPDLRLQKPLEDYIEFLENMTPRSLVLIDNLCDISMAFSYSHNNIRGLGEAKKIFSDRFSKLDNLKYKVEEFCWMRRDACAFVKWNISFDYKPSILKKKERIKINGVLEVAFSPAGKICSHTEFWADTSFITLNNRKS